MAGEPHHELIIIKRHGGHADGHHGGAWKIAFADFMTAMMALFLVLWLISATNPKQRIVIAHYFNPVKLAEVSINKKGLDDPSPGEGGHGGPRSGETYEKVLDLPPLQQKKALFNKGEPEATHEEATLFRDPYAILSEIAADPQPVPDKKTSQAYDVKTEAKADAKTSDAADNFRDPFSTVPVPAPQSATQQMTAADQTADAGDTTTPAVSSAPGDDIKASSQAPMAKAIDPTPPPAASFSSVPPAVSSAPAPVASPIKEKMPALQKEPSKSAAPSKPAAGPKPVADAKPPAEPKPATEAKPPVDAKTTAELQAVAEAQATEAEANQLRDQITTAMHQDVVSPGSPNIEVKSTPEGVLISLTDENSYSMFAVGSAEPQSKTIEVMGKVAQLLKTYPGQIVVRGHTDGRPYRSANYDNWQLSSARAQMAHYMLVRGGLEEKRIERIEGYADHQLKLANDPLAPENRRIEILLRKEKP